MSTTVATKANAAAVGKPDSDESGKAVSHGESILPDSGISGKHRSDKPETSAESERQGDYLQLLLSHERRFEVLDRENRELRARCVILQQRNIRQLKQIQALKARSGKVFDTGQCASSDTAHTSSEPPRMRMSMLLTDVLSELDKSEFESVEPATNSRFIRHTKRSARAVMRSLRNAMTSVVTRTLKLLF